MSNTEENQVITTPPKKYYPWRSIGIYCSMFGCIVILFMMYGVYYHFSEVNQNLLAYAYDSAHRLELLHNDVSTLKKSLDQSEDTIKTLQKNLTELSNINKDKWSIKEANYLVTMANQHAQFSHNFPLAVFLLKMADESLRDLSNPKYDMLRQSLAEDITRLESVASVDVTGIYMQLLAISNKINELPLLNNVPKNKTPSIMNEAHPTAWWQRGLKETWQNLRELIVIRYHTNAKLPLIPPDQKEFLYQNCYSQVMYAMWGLLHQNNKIYRESLNQLNSWIKEYFLDTSPLTKSIFHDLTQLQEIDIHPTVPEMTSLQVFSEFEKKE